MSCATPIPFETLVALWTGELTADEADRIEEHVFGCASCAEVYAGLGDLTTALGEVIPIVVSHRHRDRLAASGMRLRSTPVAAGVDARATYAADVDLLIHVLAVDVGEVDRVDLDVMIDGDHKLELAHVPFDATRGEVLIACQRHYEHMSSDDPTFVVHGVKAGQRRELGRYRVIHTWR